MGRPQRKKARRALQNVEIIPADPAPPQETSQQPQKKQQGVGLDLVPTLAASSEVQRSPDETRNQPKPCLLYTSPSPRDGLLSRMPSSA